MAPLGLWLASIGLGDIVTALSGRPERAWRAWSGWATGSMFALLSALVIGFRWPAAVILGAITAGTLAPWIYARWRVPSAIRATAALWVLALVIGVMVATAGAWPQPGMGRFAAWLGSSPFRSLAEQPQEKVAMVFGTLTFLQASANGVVRLLLLAVGTDIESGERKLRGGRIIGPMERALIFGFALAGQPTAAALVVSAKSLLRFPEITSQTTRVDSVTEYFLVGSMASWLLALAPLILVQR